MFYLSILNNQPQQDLLKKQRFFSSISEVRSSVFHGLTKKRGRLSFFQRCQSFSTIFFSSFFSKYFIVSPTLRHRTSKSTCDHAVHGSPRLLQRQVVSDRPHDSSLLVSCRKSRNPVVRWTQRTHSHPCICLHRTATYHRSARPDTHHGPQGTLPPTSSPVPQR